VYIKGGNAMHKLREDFIGNLLDSVIKMRAFQKTKNAEKYKAEFEKKVDLLIGEWMTHVEVNQKILREILKKQNSPESNLTHEIKKGHAIQR
jgi:flagellar biosynthesis chaperone FliJ